MSINPYASPQSECSPLAGAVDAAYARQQMLGAIRLYWWMGGIGCVVYLALAIGLSVEWAVTGRALSGEDVIGLYVCTLFVAPSCFSVYVAKRLATRPQGMLPHARLAGIILAVAWFPYLTVPAIICVRRVTRYHAVYCESMSVKADGQQVANKDS